MSREIGLLPLSANFEVNLASPIDPRCNVGTQADLLNSFGVYFYLGMIVSVHSDTTPSKNGLYRLSGLPCTDITNWKKIGADSFEDDFLISDWVAGAGVWYIEFEHGLDTLNTNVTVKEGTGVVFLDIITINTNTIRIQMPADFRFDGSIKIN